jgi:hypothetical protein
MPRSVAAYALALCLTTVSTAYAMVVARPTLDELVDEASSVFIGEVVDVRTQAVASRAEPTIVTEVVFSVDRVLKGAPRVQARLEFLGGATGDHRIEVAGVPTFRVGDRDVLFVERETGRVSALVGVAHGRFRLMRDPRSRDELVAFHDFRPVTDIATIGARPSRSRAGRPITLRQFESAVRERVARVRE